MSTSGPSGGVLTGDGIRLVALLGTMVGDWYAMGPLVVSLVDGDFAFVQQLAFCAIIGAMYPSVNEA